MSDDSKVASLEQHLLQLQKRMEAGLPGRAAELAGALDQLMAGKPEARDEIRRLAHRLRGTAGSYGHLRLGESAAVVERLACEEVGTSELATVTGLLIAALQQPNPDSGWSPAPSTSEPRVFERPSHGRRALAIDDDASTRRLLELTLGGMGGFDARVLGEPGEALSLLEKDRFDLVVVDAMMPSMTGLRFARTVREMEHGRRVPIAFLSAAAWDELGWALPERAVWLRKPFRPLELVSSLGELIAAETPA